jgi:hypothetical protein
MHYSGRKSRGGVSAYLSSRASKQPQFCSKVSVWFCDRKFLEREKVKRNYEIVLDSSHVLQAPQKPRPEPISPETVQEISHFRHNPKILQKNTTSLLTAQQSPAKSYRVFCGR